MKVFGITGWSGAGKTTLLTKLIPAIAATGLRVGTVKHAHHGFDLDQPGKDSWLHRQAGAAEVLVASDRRWALLHEMQGGAEPALPALLRHFSADLVLVEGFKRDPHPKLEVYRSANGKPLMHGDDAAMVAVASDVALPGCSLPVIDLGDIAAIQAMVLAHAAEADSIAWDV